MTREEAINRLEEHSGYCVPVDDLSTFEMAVDALRAQQENAKLDRSRWNGCSLCRNATYLDGDVCVSGTHYVKLSEFDFCPICCRPLTEEAWAELERRINGGTVDNKT